jgi:hypothetical protein
LFYISGYCDAVCSIAFSLFLAFSLPFVLYFWLLRCRFFYIYSIYF